MTALIGCLSGGPRPSGREGSAVSPQGVGGGGWVAGMRFRLAPTPAQEQGLLEHCSHARYVWNLAVEQH
ncbi:helix-turn-helix domain-containing protein [Actinoallomurus sp. NPDC052274]|uniref:helix-turn-helix domain-containing protein n=1 Tax=Actinoallomurus sp. NPDC052274 TaxID=3155420 RepID=UPI0034441583